MLRDAMRDTLRSALEPAEIPAAGPGQACQVPTCLHRLPSSIGSTLLYLLAHPEISVQLLFQFRHVLPASREP